MKNTINYTLIITIFLANTLISCGKPSKENPKTVETEHHSSEKEEHHDDEIHLTQKQIETIGLEFGALSSLKVNDYVKATGVLGLPPNAQASVAAKAAGIVTEVKKLVEGDYLEKGEFIAYVENPDFIVKQQEYLEAKAQLKLKKLDLIRQQTLVKANAGVAKNLENVEAEVAILEAKSTGLSKQLSYLGISTKNLTPSNIQQQISITVPMSGYVSNIAIHNGMYTQPTVPLIEIISSKHLHLELDVFEKDIAEIKVAQKISYNIPALGTKIYEGEVSVIGKEFNNLSKTVRVHGHLDGDKPLFLKDLFINAKIWLNDKIVTAAPESAIIKDGKSMFIYVAKKEDNNNETQFQKIKVISGATHNGYTAVKLLDEIPDGMNIVTKGAYYVYAQSKSGELAHEH